jgi:hypothetical protein
MSETEMARIVVLSIIPLVGLWFRTTPAGVDPTSANVIKDDEWSASVEGVRGRLVLAKDAPVNGTMQIRVYLEFQNVSDVINPTQLLPGYSLTFEVTDSKG